MGVHLRKRPSLDPTLRLRLIPGMATTATATDHTDMATTAMATDMATTTERGLLMPSLLLRLLPTQRLRLIPGMDTTDTATGLTDMATTERGLLMPSQLLKLLPTLRLRLIPGMEATATGHTDMATTATDLMVMLTGVKRYSDLSLPTLLRNTSFCKTIFFLYRKTVLFCVLGCR